MHLRWPCLLLPGDDPTATESVYFVSNHSKTRYFPLYEENGPMCYNGFSSGIRSINEPLLNGNTILARRRPAAAEVCQGRRTDLTRIHRQIPRSPYMLFVCCLYKKICISLPVPSCHRPLIFLTIIIIVRLEYISINRLHHHSLLRFIYLLLVVALLLSLFCYNDYYPSTQ